MSFFSKLLGLMKNPRLLFKKLLYRLKPYHAVVVTFVATNPRKVTTRAEINTVNWDNVNDALVYEPREKVETFYLFLEKGDIGYYGYLDGKFAHRSWITFGPVKINQWHHFAPLIVQENEAAIHWCETTPSARGFNIYPAVLSKIVSDLPDKITKVYGFTTQDNIGSFKGLIKAGFKSVNAVEVYAFMGITIYKTKKVERVLYEFNRANKT